MNQWGNGYSVRDSRLDRPASTQTAMQQKEAERQEILAAVALFQANGGVIQKVPSHLSKEAQLAKMREGHLDLISYTQIAKRWAVSPKVLANVLSKWPTLMYIMEGQERMYWIEDIQRVEKQPNYKLRASVLS